MSMNEYETITVTREGALATLLLDRPEQRNGMTNRMVREACEALETIAADRAVRVLLLTGACRSFCPGADLNWIGQVSDDPEDSAETRHYQVSALLHDMPQVTVAAINGACAGAGMGWACACDLRVATQSAMLNTAFLNVAVAGDMGLPWTLPRLVGAAKARELSFLPQKFSAEEASRIGLVARVFADEEFQGATRALIDELLERSPTALLALKNHYVAAEQMPLDSFVALEAERHVQIASGPHAAEAFRAFIEKRKPNFD